MISHFELKDKEEPIHLSVWIWGSHSEDVDVGILVCNTVWKEVSTNDGDSMFLWNAGYIPVSPHNITTQKINADKYFIAQMLLNNC